MMTGGDGSVRGAARRGPIAGITTHTAARPIHDRVIFGEDDGRQALQTLIFPENDLIMSGGC